MIDPLGFIRQAGDTVLAFMEEMDLDSAYNNYPAHAWHDRVRSRGKVITLGPVGI